MFINIFLANKFYILEKRKDLNEVYRNIKNLDVEYLITNINEIENNTSTKIVYAKDNGNINELNDEIIDKLYKKKLRLNKFWITEEVLHTLNNSSVNKIYYQEIVKYSFYTKIFKKDNYVFVIGVTLSNIDEIISIVNKFIVLLTLISIIINWIMVRINSHKIIKPLKNMTKLSDDIASLNFRTENINTKDEIEELSKSINNMSKNLEKAHKEINTQNQKLKELLRNVAHEIKTPLSIIKVHAQGIEDGLDDGSYIDIIFDEINKVDSLIENLLLWFKVSQDVKQNSKIDLHKFILKILEKYKLIFRENEIETKIDFLENENYFVFMNEEDLKIIIENLITNGIKYTDNRKIEIYLFKYNEKIIFKIINGSKTKINLDKIFTPFYVEEESRNKNFSGTGLGLSIVKEILEKYDFNFKINCDNNNFEFYIEFLECKKMDKCHIHVT